MTDAHKSHPECIFCTPFDQPERAALIVHRSAQAYVILNKFPYNNGHLMVVPVRHVARLTDLETAELLEIMVLTQEAERALTSVYQPDGFNMGINLGRPAGAGIAEHLHLHVVPRWNGDTSFMTVFDETRVLPEELPQTARRLREAFAHVAATTPAAGG